MRVTGYCQICGHAKEDLRHALYFCPHAYALWNAMQEVWHLPSHATMQQLPPDWIPELVTSLPADECAHVLMVLWRAWHARNEVTHDKPLPTIEGSRRYLCSYMRSLKLIQTESVEKIIKGKGIMDGPPLPVQPMGQPDEPMPWVKPPAGVVKLNVDGSFIPATGAAGAGSSACMHDDSKTIIKFTATRWQSRCWIKSQRPEAKYTDQIDGRRSSP